jgi:hypothetical protein
MEIREEREEERRGNKTKRRNGGNAIRRGESRSLRDR